MLHFGARLHATENPTPVELAFRHEIDSTSQFSLTSYRTPDGSRVSLQHATGINGTSQRSRTSYRKFNDEALAF